jgi:Outer membrane protein beta-barrel domain
MKRILLATAAVVWTLALTGEAKAIERQHHVGLGPSVDVLSIDDKSTLDVGAGVGLHYTYGISDQFNLMVEAGGAIVAANQEQDTPETPRTRPAGVDRAGVGVGYVIDVLQWVPYIGVLASGYRLSGGTLDGSLFIPGAELALGLDYQLSRQWAVGVAVRQHFLLTKMSTYPTYTTGLLRIEYMWGY